MKNRQIPNTIFHIVIVWMRNNSNIFIHSYFEHQVRSPACGAMWKALRRLRLADRNRLLGIRLYRFYPPLERQNCLLPAFQHVYNYHILSLPCLGCQAFLGSAEILWNHEPNKLFSSQVVGYVLLMQKIIIYSYFNYTFMHITFLLFIRYSKHIINTISIWLGLQLGGTALT